MTGQAPGIPDDGATLTIGELARLTGVTTAVLRTWEARHGFPQAHRLPGGHRRYRAADVPLVRRVRERRDAGVRLEVAIAEATATLPPESPSVFAELRRRHPDLDVHRLRKSTLIALSWAIEDETAARAERPVLMGAFQRPEFFAPSAPRWAELAGLARTTYVFAHGWPPGESAPSRISRVELADTHPMTREWSVVCDAVNTPVALSAWELPGQADVPDRERIFEAVWTVHPAEVRDAARVAAGVALASHEPTAQALLIDLADTPSFGTLDPHAVGRLFNRVVAYVDRIG